MHEEISERYQKYTAGRKKRRFLRKIVNVLCCFVIFCTTYALILPAITMEQTSFCGLEEHTHSEDCYAPSSQSVLICKAEQLSVHTHEAGCYVDGGLVCGQADYVAHSHDSVCYDVQGNLVCDLPVRGVHTHGDGCYAPVETPEPVLHVHSEACNSLQRGELICQEEEYEGHSHGSECYTVGTELHCTVAENHLHSDDCYTVPLVCLESTDPHSHSDGCYTVGSLTCEITEEHEHDGSCYERLLGCGLEDGQTLHDHGAECYGAPELICGTPENHTHADACYNTELVCTTPETPGHSHEDSCYQWDPVLSCGMEEGEEEPVEPVEPELICIEPIASVHVHGDSCLETIVSQPVPVCGKSAEDHAHTADCYTLDCGLEPHKHELACYSDPEADVENAATWEATFAHIPLTGDWNADVLAIAESQLGYEESTRNYEVWDENTIRGYTRYGHWYGSPYGDWCAMFVSFCLNYAEVEGMPLHWGVRPWIEQLTELELYFEAENYDPQPGDLVFFDWEGDGLSDHVGIVAEVIEATQTEPAKLKTIEGNSANRVQYVYYDLSDPVLLGYSKLPEKEEEQEKAVYYCGAEEHTHGESCYAEDGNLTCELAEHTHTEECTQQPLQYFCGLEEHIHGESCYAEDGNLTCELAEHTHTEECTQQPPQYFCGMEEHIHGESCYAEDGNLACELAEHTHTEECTQQPQQYFCGMEEHTHGETCYAEDGNLTCELAEHTHTEACTQEAARCVCGLVIHTHSENCYDESGNLICQIPEHVSSDTCTAPADVYLCGITEHTHEATCYNAEGKLICRLQEHKHTSLCKVDLSALEEADRQNVILTIEKIDQMPSADEIDAKIAEFAAAGDEEGEELWLTEVYQQVALTYAYYEYLSEELRTYVVNRDKLLELEYIWSIMTLPDNQGGCYIHFDGTNGNITSLLGAGQTTMTPRPLVGNTITLPTTCTSPSKYSYTLKGWYLINAANNSAKKIGNNATPINIADNYYAPGANVVVTGDMVFYADWGAATYDIGRANNLRDGDAVVKTVSTNSFVTTRMFDYSSIFNMYSSQYSNGSINANSHSETWKIVADGSKLPGGSESYGLTFRDWDEGERAGKVLSHPDNIRDNDAYSYRTETTQGLLATSPSPLQLFFNASGNSFNSSNTTYPLGVNYLGTADHLFQIDNNPESDYYGYYYYDSRKNAASYNQSENRFYVYNYIERTAHTDSDGGHDFLPFNSPYANIPKGKSVNKNNAGQYVYDHLNSSENMGGTNYWFGMSNEIRFYLPNDSGSANSNLSLQGKQMKFEFSGDDDVWVLVDGKLILDIGGIHKARKGTINFSTGEVMVETNESGGMQRSTQDFKKGEHTLTLYYMERGSSLSNCSIYFNISPRFDLELVKKDTLGNILEGSRFEVFMDMACTTKATLWPTYDDYCYDRDHNTTSRVTNVLDVSSGTGKIWGLTPGNTYYIKETVPPSATGYILPNGLIELVLDNRGVAEYKHEVIEDPHPNNAGVENPTNGFIVKEFKVDAQTRVISMTVQNTYPTTELYVKKLWEGVDLTTFPVTVNLLADDEVVDSKELSSDNNWQHTWENLPKLKTIQETVDGTIQYTSHEIQYTVQELEEVAGFTSTMSSVAKDAEVTSNSWTEVNSFSNNNVYLLKTNRGLLAADATRGLYWTNTPDEAAQWTATSHAGQLTLKNGNNLYLRPGSGNFFIASAEQGSVTFTGSNFTLQSGSATYYMTGIIRTDGVATVGTSSTLTFSLREKTVATSTAPANGYVITNTAVPGVDLTSLTVEKKWIGRDDQPAALSLYENLQVVIRLLADGTDTGQTLTLSKANSWTGTFNGLPVKDASGAVIRYSVAEVSIDDWTSTVSYNENTGIWEVTNKYSRMLEIPVKKLWHANTIPTEITIQLYSVPDNSQDKVATKVAEITVKAADNWEGKFVQIPPDELGVTYYVYEPTYSFAAEYDTPDIIYIPVEPAEGETATTKAIKVGQVTGGANTVTITNYAMESLPNTGGSGTIHYMTGGLLTTAAALILLYINKKRTIRKDAKSS